MREILWVACVAALDQISKALIVGWLRPLESREIWPGIFQITRTHNSGGAFGILQDNATTGPVITVVAALISLGILVALLAGRVRTTIIKTGLIFIGGGAIGNLIDRLRYEYVIDFLHFAFWPVFNLADAAIVLGTGLVVLGLLKRQDELSESEREEAGRA
jgi:signal peptidase II